MNEDYNIVLNKLDAFIKKYYLNMIVRGLFISIILAASLYLLITLLEYFGHFPGLVRSILFFSSLILFLYVLSYFIFIPLFKYFRLGKRINHKQAARIIQSHFPEAQDKLENTLELALMAEVSPDSMDLIKASIRQKSKEISPIPFLNAIRINKNLKYLRYIIPIAAVFILILAFWPSAISEGTERIVRYNKEFISPPPFRFSLVNDSLNIRKGDDIKIKLRARGEMRPDKVYIHFSGNHLRMVEEDSYFVHEFKNLNNPLDFYVSSGEIQSSEYTIKVLPAPGILDFEIRVNTPDYTQTENQVLQNIGDITVPLGSHITWSFDTQATDSLFLRFGSEAPIAATEVGNLHVLRRNIFQNCSYYVSLANNYFTDTDIIDFYISVVPDRYPAIQVQKLQDTLSPSVFYFNGQISDDYGFNHLQFVYEHTNDDPDSVERIELAMNPNISTQQFYYAFDFKKTGLKAGQTISYYFEVGDNDAINGSKVSRSHTMKYHLPSKEELNALNDSTNKNIEDKINEAKELSESLQKDMQKLRKDMIDKDLSQWERQQMMEKVNQKHQRLEQLSEQIARENSKRNSKLNHFSEQAEQALQKQKQIEELMKSLMDDEMKKLMEELNELMKDFNKEKLNELAEEMDYSLDDMNKELDQNLELLKRYEVEQRLENSIEQLKELSDKQKELSKQTKDKTSDDSTLTDKQKEQAQEFEELKKSYKETLDKNEALKSPMRLDEFKESFEEISEDFKKGSDQLEQNKKNKASDTQEQNSQQLQQLSKDMQSMMDNNMMMAQQEDMDDLRQVLENLIQFSFDQEDLMDKLGKINSRDPRYKNVVNEQSKLGEKYDIIRDSLNALGSRVSQINSVIQKEQSAIDSKLRKIMDEFADNRVYNVITTQQFIMTHTNNLILLLSEAYQQMQQQMAMQMCGSGNCKKKKGKGKPQMGNMRQRQESLKKQMQQMINQMKKAQQGGSKQDQNAMNKKLAKMLAEQEMMQKMLNDMMSETLSPKSAKMLNEINRMMEESMNDLINRNITPELLKRQEMIITRMLEAEKSEFEREQEKKRKSEEARDYEISNPENAFEQEKQKIKFSEMLQKNNLRLNDYYKSQYKEYLLKMGEE